MRSAHSTMLTTAPLSSASLVRRLMIRLVEADVRYRQARRLESLPEHLLRDLGLPTSTSAGESHIPQTWG